MSSEQKIMGVFQVSYLSIDPEPWTLQVGALEKSEDFPFVTAYSPDSLRFFSGHGGEQQDPGIY